MQSAVIIFFLFLSGTARAEIDYSGHVTTREVDIKDGKFSLSPAKALKEFKYAVDNNKKIFSKTGNNKKIFISSSNEKPEEENTTTMTELILEMEGSSYKSAELRTSAHYIDGKLRSATRCRTPYENQKPDKSVSMDCVTATAQACTNLLNKVDAIYTKENARPTQEEINQCSNLLKNYADLAQAFATTNNDLARGKIVENDMKRIKKVVEIATDSTGILKTAPVQAFNKTDPAELLDSKRNFKDSSFGIQMIYDAINLCKEVKNQFRSPSNVQRSSNAKQPGGTQ